MLTPGSRFGPYEIVALIGAGGMGEVYRARDTRLGRDIALKVLPPAFLSNVDRLARFEREARVLASLNHPGIASIYGIEDSEGIRALVLELVEGETLAARLRPWSAKLSMDEALLVARQIAEALDAAHERSIVHRDLKPANIGVTRTGVVKLLDFGLAKTAGPPDRPSTADERAQAPTITATVEGVVMGTAAYMSPEQARGQSIDKRTDIWAFGCVLFEMLTGIAAFGGSTMSDTIVSVLDREPDWRSLPASVPPSLRRLLHRCLQKDVRRRLRDIGDALDDLTPQADAADTAHAQLHDRWSPGEFHRLTDQAGMNEWPAISPDGKTVAFVAIADGRRQIWIQLLTGGAPLQVTRDDADHSQPRWAPDSSALIYYTSSESPGEEGTLWQVSALGGLPRPIINALGGGDISHDGRRIAVVKAHDGHVAIVTVDRDGSDVRPVAAVPPSIVWRCPRWSFDDAWLAFHGRGTSVWDERLYVVPAHGGEIRPVARASFIRGVSWLPDGRGLVYSSSAASTLVYPPTFNLHVVNVDGSRDVQITSGDVSFVEPDVHHSGRLVVCRIRSESNIWKVPVGDSPLENTRAAVQVTRQTGQVQVPSLNPDGSDLVYLSDNGGHANLWVARSDGTRARQITFERDPAVIIGVPKWSPAGDQIVYIVRRDVPQLWVIRPDGRGARKVVERGIAACWSDDGRWLYYAPDLDEPTFCIEKVAMTGGPPIVVRGDHNSYAPTIGAGVLYFTAGVTPELGSWDWEIRRASPEDGPSELLGRLAGARQPLSPLYMHLALSPDRRWLAMGLADGATTNVWALATEGGAWRQITDFEDQPTTIARQVSWSPDGQYLYAAISKNNGDIVMLDGLL
ncbi:MAG TPA: LpqB family beta-propeller domain-containing protein [Vicinamibacterales bacterium]|nr:LpqB family beta-propeller domain-containing protein [Vicinamibacterales bacterium]